MPGFDLHQLPVLRFLLFYQYVFILHNTHEILLMYIQVFGPQHTTQQVPIHTRTFVSVNPGAVAYFNAYFGSGSGPYHLDSVHCSGSESSLLSCRRSYSIGVHNCRPGNEAGVKCGKCMMHMSNSKVNAA